MIVEESQKMSISGIDDWLFTPQGRYVMAWEQARVDALVSDLFGYNALQFGLPQKPLELFFRNDRANRAVVQRQLAAGSDRL